MMRTWTESKHNDQLQILIGSIPRTRAKKLQEALDELMKEFICSHLALQEESKSNHVFGGIGVIKDDKKSINIIKTTKGDNPHDFGN